MGFPGGSVVKNLPANARDNRMGLILGSGRSPGEGNGYPLQVLAWEIPWMEDLAGYSPLGCKRVIHDWVSTHAFINNIDI